MQLSDYLSESYALQWAHLPNGKLSAALLGPVIADFMEAVACLNTHGLMAD